MAYDDDKGGGVMVYTAGQIAKMLNLTKDGLRYYEKEGLLPSIARDAAGHRVYSESDADWIFLVRCLRDTGMPIHRIRMYVEMLKTGEESLPARREFLDDHRAYLQEKVDFYGKMLKLLEKKISFYDEALSEDRRSGACKDYADEWEQFRSLLGGIRND